MINKVRSKSNCVQFTNTESWQHVWMKFQICYWLRKQGIEFWTECYFEEGGRADIVFRVDTKYTAIEILESEETLAKHKSSQYPCEIICVKANQPFYPEVVS